MSKITVNFRRPVYPTPAALITCVDKDGNPIKGIPRHPILEDDVVIYAGATILGRVRIGQGSVIGGNVWVTADLPPNSRVVQKRPKKELPFTDGGGI